MGTALLPVYVLFDHLADSFNPEGFQSLALGGGAAKGLGIPEKDYEAVLRRSLSDMSKQITPPAGVEVNYTLMRMQLLGPPVSGVNSLNFTIDMKSALWRVLSDCESKRNKYSIVSPYIFVLFTKYAPQTMLEKNWFKDKDSEWDRLSKEFDAEMEFYGSKSIKKGNFDSRLPFASRNFDLNGLSMLFGAGTQSILNQKLQKIASANKLPHASRPKNVQQNPSQSASPPPSASSGTGPLPPRSGQPAPTLATSVAQSLPQSDSTVSSSPAPAVASKEQAPPPPKPEFKPAPPAEWQQLEPPPELGDRKPHTAVDSRDVDGKWYICGASRRGKLHENEATFREDAFQVDAVSGWILVAVADGAGSHHLSRVGSNLAVKTAIETMTETVMGKPPIEEVVQSALQKALRASWIALSQETERRKSDKVEFRDLSTTLLLLMYYPKKELVGVAQIGDGLIAAQLEDGKVALLGHPESGEYSGQTYFLTNHKVEELPSKCETPTPPGPIKYFFVMTDGVADDLHPPQERLPGLIKAIPEVMDNQFPDKALLELINYNRPGSFDDRTLVVVCKRDEVRRKPEPVSIQTQVNQEEQTPSGGPADTQNPPAQPASEAHSAEIPENKEDNAGKIEQSAGQFPASQSSADSVDAKDAPIEQIEGKDNSKSSQSSG